MPYPEQVFFSCLSDVDVGCLQRYTSVPASHMHVCSNPFFSTLKRTGELRFDFVFERENATHTGMLAVWMTSFLSNNSLTSSMFLYLLKKSMGQQWLDKYWFRVCVRGKPQSSTLFVLEGEIQFLKANFSVVNRDHDFALLLHYNRQTSSWISFVFQLWMQYKPLDFKGCFDNAIYGSIFAFGSNLLRVIKNYIIFSKPIFWKTVFMVNFKLIQFFFWSGSASFIPLIKFHAWYFNFIFLNFSELFIQHRGSRNFPE